ncbi:HNH endonuclease [Acinetobacter faecalis]|uniref:HNH endonuclease n=1 Tax=Acinetobacter faecalis TaxID=2665161 RepID=UPI002A90F846|nr:HNH endonuclease signature motif containing protein [Acinetobacter faecalis]MDY6484022.1 HNH endonuclease signature motif containing protein [Acinetobacter faecalis]
MLFSIAEIPTPQEQLKFLKHIQQILQSGTFTSTYKFALLISITRLAIEQGQDTGAALHLEYQDIAEKFIELYWKQSLPFQFNHYEPFIIHQSTGKQAKIISEIKKAQQQLKTLAALRKDQFHWNQLKKVVAATVKQMPVVYLQNLNGQTIEFLYSLEDSKQSLKLLPKVMYCLRQFSEIIEELCQKRWIDFVRLNKQNLIVLDGLPDLDEFMFAPSRNQLGQVADFLIDLQQCQCFYCGKSLKNSKYAVDHFIPWSLYPADTGHNFVLSDDKCNSQKSNYLASEQFLEQWRERNHLHNHAITQEISQFGFLTDLQRSHRVADWAYKQAIENEYLVWLGGKEKKILAPVY